LLDRLGRLRLISIDYVVATAGAAALAMLAGSQAPVAALLGITFVLGVTQMFSDSGLRSLFPRLAPRALWERVNAVDSMGYQVASIVGPPVAATVFAFAGATAAFAILALAYAFAWLALRRAREPMGPPPEDARLIDATLEGLRYVWQNPTLRAVSFGIASSSVCLGICVILLPVLLIDRLAAPEWTVGVVFAVSGALGIVAAVALGRFNTIGRERSLIIAATVGIILSAVVLLPAPSASVAIGVACVFGSAALLGVAAGVWNVAVFTVRQRRTDPRMMGRAFAISIAINSVGSPIGAALGGWLSTQSIELAIYVAVGFGSVGTVLGWLMLPANDDRSQSPVHARLE
jgi:MFS family permease